MGTLCIIVFCCAVASVLAAPNFQFSFGTIEGVDLNSSATGQPLYAYYGIPFAEPPVGGLRFRPPVPFRGNNQTNVINSKTFRSVCYQSPPTMYAMSEDCLYLNIFSPINAQSTPKKVMFWIYGGGYTVGDTVLYPSSDLVVEYDVIVVTTAYRLGAFGFLSSGDNTMPGNQGLLDQILALRWVKDNIARFNGDANDITIFGESAGAGSVSLLSLSPLTRGLFTKGIMLSGTALAPWAVIPKEKATRVFNDLAKETNCESSSDNSGNSEQYHQSVMNCLQSLSPDKLLRADFTETAGDSIPLLTLMLSYGPVVDGNIIPNEPKILLNNRTYLEESGVLTRKYLAGLCNNEGLMIMYSMGNVSYQETANTVTKPAVFEPFFETTVKELFPNMVPDSAVEVVKFQYGYPKEENNRTNIQGIFDIVTDVNFLLPTIQFLEALQRTSPATDVYLYLFDYYPQQVEGNTELRGTGHGVDLAYLFDKLEDEYYQQYFPYQNLYSSTASAVTDVYCRSLTSFAKTGKPSWNATVDWPRYDLSKQSYAALSENPEVKQRIFPRRVSLWGDFLPLLTSKYFPDGPSCDGTSSSETNLPPTFIILFLTSLLYLYNLRT